MVKLNNDWDEILSDEFKKQYYLNLREFLKKEYSSAQIFPPMHDIFNALRYTPAAAVKVVIIGQDPYHGEGQAHGLCFSVREGVTPPPSLKNIFKELFDDVGITAKSGCLTKWAENGVLLLNTVLTVRSGRPRSHAGRGWEILTDKIISVVNDSANQIVFLLWGADAKKKQSLITNKKHKILTSAHPSPLSSAGFFGNRHFSQTNSFFKENGLPPVDWTL